MNSLPKTVTRQRRDCDLNPGPSAPESSTLTTRLPSHPTHYSRVILDIRDQRQCGQLSVNTPRRSVRYHTIQNAIVTCAQMLTRVSLIYSTEPKTK